MHRTKMNRFLNVVVALAGILGLIQSSVLAQPTTAPAGRRAGAGGANRRITTGGLRPPVEKELLYVTLPGTLEGSWDQNGNGIVVLDVTTGYTFVKRIPTWDVPASGWPMQVAGVTACPQTN